VSFFSQSGHWYVRNASGEIEAAHDLDLRKARKVNARPSITTVLKERSNPALDTWKQNMIFDAVIENPMFPGEAVENYKGRISQISAKPAKEAADFGTQLHDALDLYPKACSDSKLKPYVDLFGPSYDKVVKHRVCSEVMLCDDDIGVAGRTDLIADTFEWGLAVIDYKTSKFKGKPPSFWASYKLQLAFYAKAYQKANGLAETPAIVNCGINSECPTEPAWKAYTREEQDQAYAEFLAVAFLWFCSKNYWPMGDHNRWIMHAQINGKLISS
jgi:hypothetical protein